MKLSVLYLANAPSTYRVDFFNELGRYCDLTVIFERKQLTHRNEDWHNYNFEKFRGLFLQGIKLRKNTYIDFQIKNYLNNLDYDLIIVSNYSTPIGILSIRFLNSNKIPFVISVDGGLINYEESKLKKRLKTKLISSAAAWLSTGEVTNQYLTYYGANKDNIYIYPFTTMKKENIIDHPLTKNEKVELRARLKIPYSNMVISVGQFIHRKGFDVLIKAAKKFKEGTGVYIIGGEPTNEYEELIEQYDINNVHFLSFLEYEELKKYYLSADVFVLPTREDVWGLVINEAMTNGLPVVTTTSCVAGLEMVENGVNGYLVHKDNIELLVDQTNKILNNIDLQKIISRNNIIKAYEYTIENMAYTTFEILKKI